MANAIKDKSRDFAIRVINCYKYLTEEKKEFVLSKQLLKSGTSIGANCRESKNAQSRGDFENAMLNATLPASEQYWQLQHVATDLTQILK